MAAHPTRVLPPHLALLLVLGLAAPVSAQRAVVSVGHPGVAPATDLIDIAGGVVTRLTDDVTDKAVFLSDGTVLLRRKSGEQTWRAHFLATGVEIALPLYFEESYAPHAPMPVPHPRAQAVFGRYVDPLFGTVYPARVDAGGLHVLQDACPPGERFSAYDLTPNGRELFAVCVSGVGAAVASVVDSATGAVLRRLPLGMRNVDGIAIGPGGQEFVISEARPLTGIALVRLNALTGATAAEVVVPFVPPVGGYVVANPTRRDRPILAWCLGNLPGADCAARMLDLASLTLGAVAHPPGPGPGKFFVSSTGREVITSGGSFVSRVDVETGAMLNYAAAPAGGFIVAAWGAEPQAPALAPAVVVGNAVTLSWTLPVESTAATGYRLEAGSQPGLADILTSGLGAAPSFGASGVPAGRYYVRIRALNGNGVSAPSNEVIVDVP